MYLLNFSETLGSHIKSAYWVFTFQINTWNKNTWFQPHRNIAIWHIKIAKSYYSVPGCLCVEGAVELNFERVKNNG